MLSYKGQPEKLFSTERNVLKFCMHERNMLWKTHAFLAFAIQSITTQTRFRPPDAGTGPDPLMKFFKLGKNFKFLSKN